MDNLEKIIDFAKEQMRIDVHAHRGAYSTIIDYIEKLKKDKVDE